MCLVDASGLCMNAGRKQLSFAVNEVSSCLLRLNYDSFGNCTTLRYPLATLLIRVISLHT